MRHHFLFASITATVGILSAVSVHAEGLAPSRSHFYYNTPAGGVGSAGIIRHYWRVPVVHPDAQVDSRLDRKLLHAATIAQERSNARSRARCWQYVKEALLKSGAVSSYPKTNYGCQAGDELVRNYGFKKLPIRDPFAAPLGSVLVFSGGNRGAGHVELRTRNGFVSDYHTKNRCRYPLVGVYGKFSS